jgi:hypothetical protein
MNDGSRVWGGLWLFEHIEGHVQLGSEDEATGSLLRWGGNPKNAFVAAPIT